MTPNGQRLDSWKAIALYLGRDIGTVRRWERLSGLPVRRVSARPGSSVFAYTDEIDQWLQRTHASPPMADGPPAPPAPPEPTPPVAPSSSSWRFRWWMPAAVVTILLVAAWRGTPAPRADAGVRRAEVSKQALTTFDASNREIWRHRWDERYDVVFSEFSPGVEVSGDAEPVVYAATSYRQRVSDRRIESGELAAFGSDGRPHWSFAFDDTVTLGGKAFTAPWAITTFAREGVPKASRLAVAAHHYVWGASLVAILDPDGRRLGTFTHAGWVEALAWMNADTLLVAGFSESQNGGMVALLDSNQIDGQGPEAEGSEHFCDTCGRHRPRRMLVMPRSEVNRVTNSRFNRASVSMVGDRVVIHTLEMPSNTLAVDAIYEFTPALDLIRATYSRHYWETHAALEAAGTLDHPREQCPDREGPRELVAWTPDSGWASVPTRPD